MPGMLMNIIFPASGGVYKMGRILYIAGLYAKNSSNTNSRGHINSNDASLTTGSLNFTVYDCIYSL